jgi:excisionase family DNA binding protein
METASELMNVKEFAHSLGVTESCVRRWVSDQRISIVKLGRLVRIPREEQQRLIKANLRPALGGGNNEHTNN